MRHSISKIILFAILVSSVDAQEPATYISNISKTFKRIIEGASSTGKQTEFLLRVPGIPVVPEMDLSQSNNRIVWYRVLDKRPLGDLSGQTSEEQISGVYREILYDSVPVVPPDAAQVKQLTDGLDQTAADIGKIYDDYATCMEAYVNAVLAYNNAINEGQTGLGNGGRDVEAKEQKKKLAFSKLVSKGKKDEYDRLWIRRTDLLFQLDKADPFSYRKKLFEAWMETELPPPVPKMLYYPPLKNWSDDSGYTKLHFTHDVLTLNSGTRHVSASASGSYFFVFKANAEGGQDRTFSDTQINNLSIDMEIKAVLLDHIWMDRGVFSSTNWKWGTPAAPDTPAAERQVISEGKPRSDGLYYGRMPLLPTGLIIAKNVKINITLDKKTAEDIKKTISTGGGGSFLGFSLGGSMSASSTDHHKNDDVTTAGFEIKAPTIIGYICEVIPKCPAPAEPTPSPAG